MIEEKISNLEMDELIAGILDGDGHKNLASVNAGRIAGMNDREALELMHLRIGGEIKQTWKKGNRYGTGIATKDGYELRWGRQYNGKTKGAAQMPQSIARFMRESDGRGKFYYGPIRMRSLSAPGIPWFAGFFIAEGSVNRKNNMVEIMVKDRNMLIYWLNRYGGRIYYIIPHKSHPNGAWKWYNHTHMTPTIINELLPFMTNDKGRKMRELWNHYVGKIQ